MSRFRFLSQRKRDLDEEIEAHLRMAVRERVERGESPGRLGRRRRRSSATCCW